MVDGVNFNPFTGKKFEQWQIDKMDSVENGGDGDGKISTAELSANLSWLSIISGNDEEPVVNIDETKGDKNLKFNDVYNELKANVPDCTSTIEEKELALKYIDKMLSCSDIPSDAKTFWTYNKKIIEAEILAIKNQTPAKNEKFENVIKELNQFVKYYTGNAPKDFLSVDDRVNYWVTYNNTCISFYERALSASDIDDETRAYCLRMINEHKRDLNNCLIDLNNYKRDKGQKTESFNLVFEEFVRNVPDITSTASEKELALSYIDRMLSCDDIPVDVKIYWQGKRALIQSELEKINHNKLEDDK